jgi:hypothetical protein
VDDCCCRHCCRRHGSCRCRVEGVVMPSTTTLTSPLPVSLTLRRLPAWVHGYHRPYPVYAVPQSPVVRLVIILQRLLLLVRWCCYCSLGEKLCYVRLEATVTAAVGIAAAVDDMRYDAGAADGKYQAESEPCRSPESVAPPAMDRDTRLCC